MADDKNILESTDGNWIHLVLLLLIVPLGYEWAWALSTCWNWVMPDAFGLPHLTMRVAWCLSAVVGIFTFRPTKRAKTTTWEDIKSLIGMAVAPLFSVLFIWIVKP